LPWKISESPFMANKEKAPEAEEGEAKPEGEAAPK
jgi:hypothetical protein